MGKTPNLDLYLTAKNETDKTFLDYRTELSGTDSESNMNKIDTAVGNAQSDIVSLQSGVSSLRSDLASESVNRSSADSLLEARIDEIIAPSGEAPSAAEVQDARIGADNITYSNLGNAIREQIKDVKGAITKINTKELFYVPRLYTLSEGGKYPFKIGYWSGDVGETITPHASGVTKNAFCAYWIPIEYPSRISINNSNDYKLRVRVVERATGKILSVSDYKNEDYYVYPNEFGTSVAVVFHTGRVDNKNITDNDLEAISNMFGIYYSIMDWENKVIDDVISKSIFNIPRRYKNSESGNYPFVVGYWGGNIGDVWSSSNAGTTTARLTYGIPLDYSARISIGEVDNYNFRIRVVDSTTNQVFAISDLQNKDYFVYEDDYPVAVLVAVNVKRSDGGTITASDLESISSAFGIFYSSVASKSQPITMSMELGDFSRPRYFLFDQEYTYPWFYSTMRTPLFLDLSKCSSYKITTDYIITSVYYDSEYQFISTDTVVSGAKTSVPNDVSYVRFTAKKSDDSDFGFSSMNLTIECDGSPRTVKAIDNEHNTRNMTMCYVVPGQLGRDHSGTTAQTSTLADTTGLIRLPPNYDNTGEPVRLVVYAHGSDDYESKWQNAIRGQVGHDEVISYLVDEGFAVFDCFGHSSGAPITNGEGHTYGDVDCMNCYIAGIRRVLDVYNLRTDGIYVTGISSGGLAALNLAFNNNIPVLACAPLAPAVGVFARCLGYSEEQRKEYAWAMGFTGDDSVLVGRGTPTPSPTTGATPVFTSALFDYLRANAERCIGYNPIWNGVVGVSFSQLLDWSLEIFSANRLGGGEQDSDNWADVCRVCKTPIKIWISNDDANVPPNTIYNFVRSAKNGGSICELRQVPDGQGAHYAYTSSETTERTSGVTAIGMPYEDIPIYWVEMVTFFRNF